MANEDLKGKANQAKGNLKETWGELTDDEQIKASGKIDEMKGKAQEKYQDIKNETKNKYEDTKEKISAEFNDFMDSNETKE